MRISLDLKEKYSSSIEQSNQIMNFSRVESKARKVRKNSGLEIHPIERLLSEKKVSIAQYQIIVHEREDARSESVTELRKNSSLD